MTDEQKHQAKFLAEIMMADAKDGLYKQPISKKETTQTAISFLENKIKQVYDKEGKLPLAYTLHIIEQAKQIEKNNIIKAWDDGDYAYFYSKQTGIDFENGEEYYNELYSK